jgi:hypothetical protein
VQRKGNWTYIAAEVRGAMGTVTDNPEDCGGAFLITLELAAFLGWHSWREEGGGQRGWSGGSELVGGRRYLEGGKRSSLLIFI